MEAGQVGGLRLLMNYVCQKISYRAVNNSDGSIPITKLSDQPLYIHAEATQPDFYKSSQQRFLL